MKIITALKHLFIPHQHNDYKPHFFRELSVAIVMTGSIFLLGFSAGSSFLIHKTVLGASVTANILVDLTNESRLAYNEAPLLRSSVLDKAATLKAEDMTTIGYFAHNSPTGVTPWHWFQEAGYVFLYAGENLAINFTDATAVRDAWLASPTHRANLLDVKFKEIGMATLSGLYKDGPAIYVVQLFGTPAVAKAVEVATTSPVAIVEPTRELPKPKDETPAPESKLAVVSSPEIKGEATENNPALQPIVTTTELAIVKNNETTAAQTEIVTPEVQTYSKWYERLLFGGSYYADIIFRILMGIVLIALVTMLMIEIRKQHWKHIAYGLGLLLIITLCFLINQSFW